LYHSQFDILSDFSFHSIGKVQRRRNDINDSIENFKASLHIKNRRIHKKQSSVAETLEQLGELHAIKGDTEQTVFYYEEALIALKGSTQRAEAAKIHEALGKAYDENKDYPKAKSNYAKALKIVEKLYGSRDSRVANIIHRLGNVQRRLGDNQEALSLYQKGKPLSIATLMYNDGGNSYSVSTLFRFSDKNLQRQSGKERLYNRRRLERRRRSTDGAWTV
jgi:tetratricopeptide (TPR) repeat protein